MDNPFTDLCQFIRREDDGTILQDPAYRAYNLEYGTGDGTFMKALRRLGRENLDELRADLDTVDANILHLKSRVIRWYTLYRFNRGELSKRALRKRTLPAE